MKRIKVTTPSGMYNGLYTDQIEEFMDNQWMYRSEAEKIYQSKWERRNTKYEQN